MKEKRKSKREKSINKFTQIYMKIIFFILLFSLFFSCNGMNDILPDRNGNGNNIDNNDNNNDKDKKNDNDDDDDDIKSGALYTLKLDSLHLAGNDRVSFSESGSHTETTAFEGSNITIYYTLDNINITNELILSFGPATGAVILDEPKTDSFTYTINSGDAIHGEIIITAAFVHTDRIPLHPPINVHFDQTGNITFTADANNPANTTYSYTLYNDYFPVLGFRDQPIAKGGEIIPALVAEMLSAAGYYYVRIKAHTANLNYDPESVESPNSEAVTVCSVTVLLNNAASGEKVTVTVDDKQGNVNNIDITNTGTVFAFEKSDITITPVPNGYRYASWSGIGGTALDMRSIIGIDSIYNITVTFADPVITIIRQPAAFTKTATGFTNILTVTATATGNASLTYQWYSNTTDNNTGGTVITTGGSLAAFTIPTPELADGEIRYYYCIVSAPGAVSKTSNVAKVEKVNSAVISLSDPVLSYPNTHNVISPIPSDREMTIIVKVSGFLNKIDAEPVKLVINPSNPSSITGLTITGHESIHGADDDGTKTFNVKITYNGTTPLPSGVETFTITGVAEIPNVTGFNYSYTHTDKSVTVNIRDGLTESRYIPIIYNNIISFMSYAGTAAGRTGKFYKQTEDISLTQNWNTIQSTAASPFNSVYDGAGFKISNFNGTNGMFNYIGINGVVKNLGISGTINSTVNFVGSIAAYNRGLITNCYSNVTVSSTGTVIGGIVGYNVEVNAGNIIGPAGRIENCYNTANISGNGTVGGITGRNYGFIKNGYNTGNITGGTQPYAGGIAGAIGTTNIIGNVDYCYNTGIVFSGGNYIGGVVGDNHNDGITQNSVSLGLRVTGNNWVIRVVGSQNGIKINLKARKDMFTKTGTNAEVQITSNDPTSYHGADIAVDGSVPLFGAGGVFEGWDTTVWNIPAGNLTIDGALPTLKNTGGNQNPTLP